MSRYVASVISDFIHSIMLTRFGHLWLFATPWTLAHQAPLLMGILQARTLEWVVTPSSRSSWPRDRPRNHLHGQVGSLPLAPPGKPMVSVGSICQSQTPKSSHPTPPSLLGIHTFVSTSASPFLLCKQVRRNHLSRFHIYALIYDILMFLTHFTLYNILTSTKSLAFAHS